MKKIFVLMLTIAILFCGMVSVSAEETMDFEQVVDEETVLSEHESETEDLSTDVKENPIDLEEYADQFVQYIYSGSSGSNDLMEKIIAMGEQYQTAKAEGYTFKERLVQLLTPENVVTTAAAAFLFICGVAFFIFRRKQKRDVTVLRSDISTLKQKYIEETETNRILRETVENQSTEIGNMKEILLSLAERSDISKQELAHVEHTAEAVARMVKDVFLNSKTIDASGKALVVHNYMDALGKDEKGKEAANE